MNRVAVEIPAKGPIFPVHLLFEHDYAKGDGPFDYIHMVRSRELFTHKEPSRVERDYWNYLEEGRR